jgi:hypothetical protein
MSAKDELVLAEQAERLAAQVAERWDELVEAAAKPPTDETWLTRRKLADRWEMPARTLDQWASQGRGPKYALFGRHARYRLSDVIAWENQQFSGGAA